MVRSRIVRVRIAWLVFLTLLATLLGDFFFFRQPVGWTLSGFFVLLLMLLCLNRPLKLLLFQRLLIAILLGLDLALLIEPGWIAFSLEVAGLTLFSLSSRYPVERNIPLMLKKCLSLLKGCLSQSLHDWFLVRRRHRRTRREKFKATRRLLHAWFIPVLLSSVFILLFSVANPIIEVWVGKVFLQFRAFLIHFFEIVSFARIGFWLLLGSFLWTLFRAKLRTHRCRAGECLEGELEILEMFSVASTIRCLALFNIVFAFESALDLRYLLAGSALPEGMSYATYAHRGAYPLIATTLLAAIFVLMTFRPGGVAEESGLARALVFAWIGQNALLLFSTLLRLNLYIDAFNFTRWRLAALIWVILVAIGFLSIAIRIVRGRSNGWLWEINSATLLSVLLVSSFVNFDGLIASYNVRSCSEIRGSGPSIDLKYIYSLGPDTLPALDYFISNVESEALKKRAIGYRYSLRGRLKRDRKNWRAWTISRSRLYHAHFNLYRVMTGN